MQRFVDPLGVQNQADGEQHVHLIRLLLDLIVLVALYLEGPLHALDVEQDVGEGPDCVRIAAHHHVREADVVEHGDLASWHAGVEALFVQLDLLQHLHGEVVVAEQRVQSEETHEREVAHHLVERVLAKLAGHRVRISTRAVSLQLLVDIRFVHHGMENVEDWKEIGE